VPPASDSVGEGLPYKPLYQQVKERLLARISEGKWTPGQLLPSEIDIAAELRVSSGTVRKALKEMASENVISRRQGLGTFVAKMDEERVLFQFFRLLPDAGGRDYPDSRLLSIKAGRASAEAAQRLNIQRGEAVFVMERVRLLKGRPYIHDMFVFPQSLFPELEKRIDIANNLYVFFSEHYGVTIAKATEQLKAVPAGPRQAKLLELDPGECLLSIDRVSYSRNGVAAEWRVSLCRTDKYHYRVDIS
jgi:GntR family transcriptional regulator